MSTIEIYDGDEKDPCYPPQIYESSQKDVPVHQTPKHDDGEECPPR